MSKLPRRRIPKIDVTNGHPTTTSREIAIAFGKEHRVVLLRIRELDCSEAFRLHNFVQTPYTDEQNKQEYTEYRITKDGFAFLCMGFTGPKAAQFKELYIERFNAMAEKLAKKQPNRPLAGTHPAHSAIKPIALTDQSAASIGARMPPLPEGLAIPPAIAQQIEAAAIPLAMRCLPALRGYLERLAYQQAHNNTQGWLPQQLPQALARASLQDALAHEAHTAKHNIVNTLSALNLLTAEALARVGKGQAA